MKLQLFIAFLTLSIIKIGATGQVPDKIIINNKEYSLLNNPLNQYFKEHPDDHPIYGKKMHPKNGELMIPFSTANARGYIATFKIENNILSLVDLELLNLDVGKREYASVFKKIFGDKKIVLNYSGILVIPTGKLLESSQFGYSSLHDKYQLVTIQKDEVIKEKEVDKEAFIHFRIKQFEAYKETKDYKTEVKQYLEDWNSEKKMELDKKNLKGMPKAEITHLKKNYENPPNEEYIDGFLFVFINPDFVIVDY